MTRVVIDTSVLVRYLLKPSAATRWLVEECWLNEAICVVTSPELVAELTEVLHRPKISKYVTDEDASAILDAVKSLAELLPPLGEIPHFTRDPKDDKFVACAIAGGAKYVITYDEDLLVLRQLDLIRITTPEEFVQIYDGGRS